MDSLGNAYGEPYQTVFQSDRLVGAALPAFALGIFQPADVALPPLADAIGPRFAQIRAVTATAAAAGLEGTVTIEAEAEDEVEDTDEEVLVDEDEMASDDELSSLEDSEEDSESESGSRRRRRTGHGDGDGAGGGEGRLSAAVLSFNAGRAARANRRADARDERMTRRVSRQGRNQRRSGRSRRQPNRLRDAAGSGDNDDEGDLDAEENINTPIRFTTGRKRRVPERLGVMEINDEENSEDTEDADEEAEDRGRRIRGGRGGGGSHGDGGSEQGTPGRLRVRFMMKRPRAIDGEDDDSTGPSERPRRCHRRAALDEDEDGNDDENDPPSPGDAMMSNKSFSRSSGAAATTGSGGSSAAARARGNSALKTRRSSDSYGWLLQDRPHPGAYVPQLGDALVYVPQGHAEYLEGHNNKFASKPWNVVLGMRYVEPVRVTGVIYSISQDGKDKTVATLRLRVADPPSPSFGTEFEVDLPQLDDADYLVPIYRYQSAASKGWRVDDRCAVLWQENGPERVQIGNWWHGVVESVTANSAQWQGSPWNALNVDYYNVLDPVDKIAAHSFWELYDEAVLHRTRSAGDGREGSSSGAGRAGCRDVDPDMPSLDPATACMLIERVRKARANPDYDPFMDTIGSDVSFTQCDGTRANYCSLVPLPMALDTVLRRLQLGYYRQVDAFRHDVATILSNCELFNGGESEYTVSAAELQNELCHGLLQVDHAAPILGVEPAAAVPPAPDAQGRQRRR